MELQQQESEAGAEEHPLLHYLFVIRKRWGMVASIFLLGCLIVGTYSLLSPKVFEATASVLPPGEGGGRMALLSGLLGQSGPGAALGGMLPGSSTSKDTFLGILKSRTMQDDVIKKFDLVKLFGLEQSKIAMRKSRKAVEGMTDIKVGREGVISVTVRATDPKMAADIANFYVENLDRMNTIINTSAAGRSRLFLEEQVTEAKKDLREAEERLREYQARTKTITLEGQTKAAIEGAATLEGQILAAELQLKALETYATPRNPDVIRMRESIEEMRRQQKRIEYGRKGEDAKLSAGGTATDFLVPLGLIPTTGLELVRLIRDAKIQETIFGLLTQQLEEAKIAEARDTPTVKILDRAVEPEWKSYPRVLQNTILGGFFSMIVGIGLSFLLEDLTRRGLTIRKVRSAMRSYRQEESLVAR